jgi:glycosyltransferase involved in cell wall biosynthesis
MLKDQTIEVIPILFLEGEFREISKKYALNIIKNCQVNAMEIPKKNTKGRAIQRVILRMIKRILPALVISKIKTVRNRNAPKEKVSELSLELKNNSAALNPKRGDLLFISGLGWEVFDYKILSLLKKKTDMKIASFIYDLIPVLFPELMGGDYKDFFFDYFQNMAKINDIVFCISKCTQNDFIEFCSSRGMEIPKTKVITLGSNVTILHDIIEIDQIGHLVEHKETKFALTVGTFEIRKNYKLLLDAWSDLCKDNEFNMNLIIVGMPGWKSEESIRKLKRSKLYNTRIYWYENLSDSGLSWLYNACQVFVYPSLYEGWGLPIVEALIHMRPAIISNRGAIPEAGMGLCTVVDPDDFEEWKHLMRVYSRREKEEKQYDIEFPSWDDTASIVAKELMNIEV